MPEPDESLLQLRRSQERQSQPELFHGNDGCDVYAHGNVHANASMTTPNESAWRLALDPIRFSI